MVRVKDKDDLYVHQDANWNVIGLTDLGGSLVERHVYRPYGEITIHQETSFGDRDGDGDVDSTDKGTPGTTCTGTVSGACRILDLDFDGDYDSTDASLFDSLPQGNARHPGRLFTSVDQPFGHQGLLFDAEIGSYQNRARQYDPAKRRFAQRDRLGYRSGLNLFSYNLNNPFRFVDPSGMVLQAGSPIQCELLKVLLNSAVPSGTATFDCCEGRQLTVKSRTNKSCALCDQIDEMVGSPTVYTIDTLGTDLASGEPDATQIHFNVTNLNKFPKSPPSEYPEATTRGEIIIHELAENECVNAGGIPKACHDGQATEAQRRHREDLGQDPPNVPNFDLGNTGVFSYPKGHTRYPRPNGPPVHYNRPYRKDDAFPG